MAVLNLLLDHWMISQFPRLRCITYVDDWQFVHDNIARHPDVVARLQSFVDAVTMTLDAKKDLCVGHPRSG